MPEPITADVLRSKGACTSQVALFERHFPEGIIPSLELVPRFAGLFDLDWAANNLLRPERLAVYEAAIASALAAYRAAIAPALVQARLSQTDAEIAALDAEIAALDALPAAKAAP